jgi:hypothetical protein
MPLSFVVVKTRRFRLLWKLKMAYCTTQTQTSIHLQTSRVGEVEYRILVEFYGVFYEIARDSNEETSEAIFRVLAETIERNSFTSPAELTSLVTNITSEMLLENKTSKQEDNNNPTTLLSSALKSNDKTQLKSLLASVSTTTQTNSALLTDAGGQSM